jgi:YggT family protein
MGDYLITFLSILIQILIFAIVGRALLSWFPIDPRNPLVRVLNDVTEPVLAPLRRVIPRIGPIDITPMVAIVVLFAVQQNLLSL